MKNGPALGGHGAIAMQDALQSTMGSMPAALLRSLTSDRGKELSAHAQFTIDTGIAVYFADPHSPPRRPGRNQQQTTEDPRLKDASRSPRRAPTVHPRRCCNDRLNPANTRRSRSPRRSSTPASPASPAPSARSATPSTTRSWSPPSGSTRPRSSTSTTADHGRAGPRSNERPPSGSIGSTSRRFTTRSGRSHRSISRTSTVTTTSPSSATLLNPSLRETQGDSALRPHTSRTGGPEALRRPPLLPAHPSHLRAAGPRARRLTTRRVISEGSGGGVVHPRPARKMRCQPSRSRATRGALPVHRIVSDFALFAVVVVLRLLGNGDVRRYRSSAKDPSLHGVAERKDV